MRLSSIRVVTTGLLVFLNIHFIQGQVKSDDFLKTLLEQHASPLLKDVLSKPDSFQYQLIYTMIDRDANNKPGFHRYFLNVDRSRYFNPASMVKMPLSFLALEKIHTLSRYGVDKFTDMLTDSSYSAQSTMLTDTSAEHGMPSIAQYVRKVFLVSDNESYNRLYEFIGQQTINERLHGMGYPDARITRRFVTMNEDENRHTNAIRFVRDGKLLYEQPAAFNQQPFDFSKQILVGDAHFDRHDSLIHAPMDFTTHNNLPLEDMQQLMQSVLFPNSVEPKKRFNLSEEDYRFLYRYMSELPHESAHPKYDTSEYFDSYTKFFFFKAGKQKIPDNIRVFNKTGWSYGYLTDVDYIVDFKNRVEFMLSAVIYTNSDGVLNDNKYEYETIGYPFFAAVGEIIYQYELTRKRKHLPDLSAWKFSYH